MSSAPFYVLITVVDDTTGQARTGCTFGHFVLGAIHREFGLPYDSAANEKALNMALANASHVFHFSKPDALANVAFRYSPEDLEEARKVVQPLNDRELHERFAAGGDLQAFPTATRDARACALIERGLWVRRADLTGELALER